MLELTAHSKTAIALAAVRLVGDTTRGNDECTQMVVDAQGLSCLKTLLLHKNPKLRKESCWALSNIAAGTPAQLAALLNADVLGLLVQVIKNDVLEVKREAIWVINRVSAKASAEMVPHIISHGVVEALCLALPNTEALVIGAILSSLKNFLDKWKDGEVSGDKVAKEIEGCGGLKTIEELQFHQNKDISKLAVGILEKHFCAESAEEMV